MPYKAGLPSSFEVREVQALDAWYGWSGWPFWSRAFLPCFDIFVLGYAESYFRKKTFSWVKMKLNIHIRLWWGKEKQKKSPPQEQTAGEFCQLACSWELVKSSGQSYFNSLTRCSKAAGGAAWRELQERFSGAENFPAYWQRHRVKPAGTLTTPGSVRVCVMAEAGGWRRGFLSFTGYLKWYLSITMPRLAKRIDCHE